MMSVNVICTGYCHKAPRVPCMRRNHNNSSAFVSPRINIRKAPQLILAKGIFIYFNSYLKKNRRETDSGSLWKDSEVESWSLSQGRHSAPVVYITDEKQEDSNMNSPFLTSMAQVGWHALEAVPGGAEIHMKAFTRTHSTMKVHASVLCMYCVHTHMRT